MVLPARCRGAAQKPAVSIIDLFCVLLRLTFPGGWRLGRCAECGSADTPPALDLPFPLISFPRSILCQTYSSGVGQYLYTYQAQRENQSCTCYTTLKKQPNMQQALFAIKLEFCSNLKVQKSCLSQLPKRILINSCSSWRARQYLSCPDTRMATRSQTASASSM